MYKVQSGTKVDFATSAEVHSGTKLYFPQCIKSDLVPKWTLYIVGRSFLFCVGCCLLVITEAARLEDLFDNFMTEQWFHIIPERVHFL